MFGIDPKAIENMQKFQAQIQAFMAEVLPAVRDIKSRLIALEMRLQSIEGTVNELEPENG